MNQKPLSYAKAIISTIFLILLVVWLIGVGCVQFFVKVYSEPLSDYVDTSPKRFVAKVSDNQHISFEYFGSEIFIPTSESKIYTAIPIVVNHEMEGVVVFFGENDEGDKLAITRYKDSISSLSLDLLPLDLYEVLSDDTSLSGLFNKLHYANRHNITIWNLPYDIYLTNVLFLKAVIWPPSFSGSEVYGLKDTDGNAFLVKGNDKSDNLFSSELHYSEKGYFYRVNSNNFKILEGCAVLKFSDQEKKRSTVEVSKPKELMIISQMSKEGISKSAIEQLISIYNIKMPERSNRLSTLRSEVEYLGSKSGGS